MALVNPSSTLTEIVTTTLRNRTGVLADNVTKNNALLNRLKKKGKVKMVSGGRTIVQELEYAENGTYKRYSGYEVLNISPSDVFTGAEFNYAQSAVAVSISGLEMIQNSGEEAIIDLLEGRIANAEKTMANNTSLDCYSDGTADGGRQIGGLQALVAATNTNTVGGINAGTYTFWQNTAFSSATTGGAAASAGNILDYMDRVWVQQVRGADAPDLIIADNNYWKFYLQSLQAIQRINSNEEGAAGFQSLKYMTSDVILDGGVGGGAPTNTMYFLNTDYIYFRPATGRFFEPLGDERFAVNQDAMVKLIGFAGNMTVANRRLQAVLGA
jgi:hypothetical protein